VSGIAVIGSVAFDDIVTPSGRADDVLGGSATHFAVAASFFAPVHLIAVVGEDFRRRARTTSRRAASTWPAWRRGPARRSAGPGATTRT
jgi:sugar/nucleoside kinase (ribokinase family)